jgi:hypothetical protein
MDGPQGRWIVRADAVTLESLKTASEHRTHSGTVMPAIDKHSD